MLSILIPVYAYDVRELVISLHQQAEKLTLRWEICVLDDASPGKWSVINRELEQLPRVSYQELPKNVGRAKIRNLLATRANYEYLLFLDCDSSIPTANFLAYYQEHLAPERVLCGGRIYLPNAPADEYHLHWWYGSQREVRPAATRQQTPYQGFMTNNFVVPKEVIQETPFAETIKTYGHEDTLFGFQLQRAQVDILHLDNAVVHVGLDKKEDWLKKQQQAAQNLYRLHRQYPRLTTRALRWWLRLHRAGFLRLAFPVLQKRCQSWEQQLLTQQRPNLRLLDLLKIYWLEETHRAESKPFLRAGSQ